MSFHDVSALRRFAADRLQKLGVFETPQLFCDVYCLEPGQAQKPHVHEGATKLYYVLEGRGRFQVGDETRALGPGELAAAGPGELHGVVNDSAGRLVALVVMAPNPNAA